MSAPYLGDFVADDTVHHMWSTYDSVGGSVTRAGDGVVSVYKDNGATQSTAGVTDTEDFDGVTGIHALTIVTTDAFYTTGANYTALLTGATVDGQTVNAVLAHFSIENRTLKTAQADLDTLTGTDGVTLATAQGNYAPATAADAASPAEVATEISDALRVDTFTELSQGVPAVSPTMEEMMMLLYMALRNKLDIDVTGAPDHKEIHNDAGTVITKKVVTDTGSVYSEAKMISGP